ncbi:MAG: HepT-like ribonuclease domain-containing protein, partial [Desulfobacterales bacterium]
MLKSDWIRLRHMLDAAKEARSFIKNEERASIEKDRKLVLALIKSIEIIGEAANKVTKECREGIPQIPWPNIISMRNRLIHAYFNPNIAKVEDTAGL